MHKPAPNQSSRLRAPVALIALIVAMAIPSAALAQDPAADQYAPTAPSGSGNLPTSPTTGHNPSPVTASGDGQPSDSSSAAPVDSSAPAPIAPATDDAAGVSVDSTNKAQRTVDKIAADATLKRDEGAAGRGSDPAPAAELLRSDNPSGSGMGVFFWIVLGGTLLWAIASGVANFRDRRGGDDAPRGQADTGNGQPA